MRRLLFMCCDFRGHADGFFICSMLTDWRLLKATAARWTS